MRLYQDDIFQKGEKYIRIVRIDRYEVEFKTTTAGPKGDGETAVLPKKEFCRLIRGMELVASVKMDAPKDATGSIPEVKQ